MYILICNVTLPLEFATSLSAFNDVISCNGHILYATHDILNLLYMKRTLSICL